MVPFYVFTVILFLVLSPILVLVRYIFEWDDLSSSIEWVWDDLIDRLFKKLFGWIITIRPN